MSDTVTEYKLCPTVNRITSRLLKYPCLANAVDGDTSSVREKVVSHLYITVLGYRTSIMQLLHALGTLLKWFSRQETDSSTRKIRNKENALGSLDDDCNFSVGQRRVESSTGKVRRCFFHVVIYWMLKWGRFSVTVKGQILKTFVYVNELVNYSYTCTRLY